MCHMSAHPRNFVQNNQKVLLTPLAGVSKTPFPCFQRGKKFWKVLQRLQIISTYSQGLEAHKLERLAAMYLATGVCHNTDIKTQCD